MPKWVRVSISAAVGALITFGTAFLALLQNLPEGAQVTDIGQVSLWIAAGGAIIGALKDVQAYLAAPPE